MRAARPDDVPAMHGFITELAEYERSAHEVLASQDDLARNLFSAEPAVHAHVAELVEPEVAPSVVGMAVWYVTYSTWLGRHGIWLEDLYVTPDARRLGAARALVSALAEHCRAQGYGRLEWWVLDWNEPALAFYRSLGAAPMQEWTVQRVQGPALARLAARPTPAPVDVVSDGGSDLGRGGSG